MKKRIISMLLIVLMVLSLFSGLTVGAHAATINGANTIQYTMAQGDYVLRICQKLGLNYYTCKDAIMILNNITDGQWNKLTVGRVLTMPASDNDAILISTGARPTAVTTGATATTATVGAVTGTATTGTPVASTVASTATAAAVTSDTLAYYLVPYTMSYGETVSGVCNNLGVNFSIFSPFIKQVNNITNWNNVRAGDTLIIPTPVCPVVGTTCYGVMNHKVASSDTAYGIVSSKGISYSSNERLLKVLNQTDNLGALTAGGNFFYPVPLTVSVPGTGNPGTTATTTTTTTVTDGNGTTTTQTTTTSKLYKLTSGMAASDGTMLFYVNNKPVTAAPAGAKVTVVTSTNYGRAIQSVTVKNSDGTADIHLTGDTFVMPSCDARVDATFSNGHDINITSNYSGKAAASVNNISVQSAVKGAAVVIKSTDPNYEISAVYATYRKLLSASTKTSLTISSSKAFVMPDADVDVEVILKPVSTYSFYVNDPDNGSFYLQVNGSAVTRAAKGTKVTVVAVPETGYEPSSLKVYKHGGTPNSDAVTVFSNTFTMPAYDVDIEVEFTGKGNNNILLMPSQIASIFAFNKKDYATKSAITSIDDVEDAIVDASTNEEVYLVAAAVDENDPEKLHDIDSSEYDIDYDIVRNSDGLKIKVNKVSSTPLGNAFWFSMPKGGVTVTPIITAKDKVNVTGEIYLSNNIKADKYVDCSFSITYQTAGKDKRVEYTGKSSPTIAIPTLEYVDLRYESAEGISFVKYKVTVHGSDDDAELSELLTNEANNHGYFQIPVADRVIIEAHFDTERIGIGQAAITGIGSLGYEVGGITGGYTSSATCKSGDTITVYPVRGKGYDFDDDKYSDKLIVTRKDNGARLELKKIPSTVKDVPYAYQFTMPAVGVNLQAIFDAKPFIITMRCVDETNKPITETGIWQIAINWVVGAMDIRPEGTKVEVNYEDYVTVAMTEAGWSKYDMVSFRIDDLEYTADELNFFYNFQMIEDRAKDHTIVAVLRPKKISIHNLSAVYDVTKGGVEFMIIKSPSGYSDEFRRSGKDGPLTYVNRAIAGDTVAIFANSIDKKYEVKVNNISITPWGTDANRVVPVERWINTLNGDVEDINKSKPAGENWVRGFTFTMPDSDITITVNFNGTKHAMTISVFDAETNEPVNGMIRLFANNFYRDVASDASFDDIPYKTPVQILRSELALAETKVIRDVEIYTESGKSVPYTDLTSGGEGISFTMPEESVWVIIRIDDLHYNTPVVVNQVQVKNGSLVFRKSDNVNDPVRDLKDFKAGDIVYVFDEPSDGYKHLGLGDLKVYVNGVQNNVNVQKVVTSPHIWSFTMPEGVIILKAEFEKEEKDTIAITLKIEGIEESGITGKAKVSTNGSTQEHPNNTTFKMLEGQSATIVSDTDGYTISSIVASKEGANGSTYTVPDLDDDEWTPVSYAVTLTVTMKKDAYNITWSNQTNGSLLVTDQSGNGIISAKYKDPVTVTAEPKDGYQVKDGTLTVTNTATGEVFTPSKNTDGTWSFYMPDGNVQLNATFINDENVMVEFTVEGGDVNLSMSGMSTTLKADQSPMTWQFKSGTVINVSPVDSRYNNVNMTATAGTVNNRSYTVGAKDGLTTKVFIYLSSSNTNITKKTMKSADLEFYSDEAKTKPVSTVAAGEVVYVVAKAKDGYNTPTEKALHDNGIVTQNDRDKLKACMNITKVSDGKKVNLVQVSPAMDDTSPEAKAKTETIFAFEMPAGGVNAEAIFEPKELAITVKLKVYNGTDFVDDTSNPQSVNISIDSGNTVTFKSNQTFAAHINQTIKVSAANNSSVVSLNDSKLVTSFKIPAIEGSTYSETLVVYVVPLTSGSNSVFSSEAPAELTAGDTEVYNAAPEVEFTQPEIEYPAD